MPSDFSPEGSGKLSILLVAHVDTVFNRGEAAKRPFKVDENGFAWGLASVMTRLL